MKWQQLIIYTNEERAEAFGSFLEGQGAISVTYSDDADSPVYEPEKGSLTLWPNTNVTGLFDEDTNLANVIKHMGNLKCYDDTVRHRIEEVEDKDWTREWMADFQPLQFGNRLWICPSWLEPPEPTACNIMLDPGLAFGTGTHPTTAMCLEWLDAQNMEGKTVTDYGCGSGILAIAALKLGASDTFAIDIDPQAIIASQANAEKNNVAHRLSTHLVKDYQGIPTNIVIANILSGPLKSLFPTLSSLCKKGGSLVLSGILKEQAVELIDVYQDAFDNFVVLESGEWVRIVATKI